MIDGSKEIFVSSLIEKTKLKSLIWNKLSCPVSAVENAALFQQLLSTEKYHVIFSESYFSNTKQGYIYLIYSWGDSGINGNSLTGYSLYIQENSQSPLYQINSNNLNYLASVIRNNENESGTAINKFIDSFLNNQ